MRWLTLLNSLDYMLERQHTFTEPENVFTPSERGFTDFIGNRLEFSAAFFYRIYDDAVVEELRKIAEPLLPQTVERSVL